MSRAHRRMGGVVGVAFGALLASPLIALCTGSVVSADTTDDLVRQLHHRVPRLDTV